MRRFPALILALIAAAPLTGGAARPPTPTAQTATQVQDLRRQLTTLGAAEQAGEGTMDQQRAQLEVLNARETELKARIARNQGQLVQLLSALQAYQRHPPPPLLVTPRSAKDAVRAAILIKAIAPALEARGKAFAEQAETIRKIRRSAALASAAYFRAESDVAEGRSRIDALAGQKQDLEQRLYADAEAADAKARSVAARAGSVDELVQGLNRAGPATTALPTAAPTHLIRPVQGKLETRFGAHAGRSRSEGWTYRASDGAVVLAPAEAGVEYAGPLKGWGLVVILRLGGGYHLVLAGLDRVVTGAGRTVTAGEPVGRMADGGNTPPALYLEVRKDATPVDPGRWLPAA